MNMNMNMQITNTKLTFGTKFSTVEVLELTTLRRINSECISAQKKFIDEFWDKPFKAAGNRGYRYYMQIIGEKIMNKYPEIAKATEDIQNYLKHNPEASKNDLKEFVKPITAKLGNEIDITL